MSNFNSESLTDDQSKQLSSVLPFEFIQSYEFKSEEAKKLMAKKYKEVEEIGEDDLDSFIPLDSEYKLKCSSSCKGLGVVAAENIKPNMSILTYFGEVSVSNKKTTNYVMQLDCGLFIDATFKGGLHRLVNHSCTPNCVIENYWRDGMQYAVLVSSKTIKKETELTYDYNFSLTYGDTNHCCSCESPNCRGSFGIMLPKDPPSCRHQGCDYQFTSYNSLYNHHLQEHVFPNGFYCQHKDCKNRKPYTSMSGLFRHINQKHDQSKESNRRLKLIMCPTCGSDLKGPAHFLEHTNKCSQKTSTT